MNEDPPEVWNISAVFRWYLESPDKLNKYWAFPGSVCCEQSQRCWGWRRWRSTWRSLLFSHRPLQTWSSPERKLNHHSRIGIVWYRILFGLKGCLLFQDGVSSCGKRKITILHHFGCFGSHQKLLWIVFVRKFNCIWADNHWWDKEANAHLNIPAHF